MVQLPAYGALALLVTGGLGVTIPDSTLCSMPEGAFKSNSRNTKQRPRSQNRSLLPPITTCNWEILGVSKMHSICSLFKAYLRMFSEDCTSQLYRCSITPQMDPFSLQQFVGDSLFFLGRPARSTYEDTLLRL